MRPLQIYLDSSDFSNLSNPGRPSVYDDIERKLLTWLDAGAIEIRFSYLHVVEASPIKPENIESARARFQKIVQLCGKKCLTSTISIIEREISNPGEWQLASYSDWLYRNDGDWLPSTEGLAIEELSLPGMLRKEIHSAASDRITRRKMERELFDSRGRLKSEAKSKLQASQRTMIREFEERFPLPPGAAERIVECMVDAQDATKCRSILRTALSDISYWPDWYQEHWDRVEPVSSFLRKASRETNEMMNEAIKGLKRAYAEGLHCGLSADDLDRLWKKGFKEAISPMYGNIVKRLANEQGIEDVSANNADAWSMRPGLAAALAVQCQIARRNMGLAGKPRQADEGDFGDVLHCVHLPFVDFFRADGFVASIIIEAKMPFLTKVVPKLIQLPAAIEDRLKE